MLNEMPDYVKMALEYSKYVTMNSLKHKYWEMLVRNGFSKEYAYYEVYYG